MIFSIKFISMPSYAFRLKAVEMSFASKLNFESLSMFASFIFYLLTGIILFIVLGLNGFNFIHIGILAILNVIAAYGLFKKRGWSLWVVTILFFLNISFSAFNLYYFFGSNIFLDLSLTVFIILTVIFTICVAAKRDFLTG
ncbi:hypothetical protein CW708_00465 [Candidatus Bathyarchaeota archaeon]|nr:MAG: hypothetical protein CW708_00465 [Candidatus Bathyarchaeota archaeon]